MSNVNPSLVKLENYAHSLDLLANLNAGDRVYYDPQEGKFSIPSLFQSLGSMFWGENVTETVHAFADFNKKMKGAIAEISSEIHEFDQEEISRLLSTVEKIKRLTAAEPVDPFVMILPDQVDSGDEESDDSSSEGAIKGDKEETINTELSKLDTGLIHLTQGYELSTEEEKKVIYAGVLQFKERSKAYPLDQIEQSAQIQTQRYQVNELCAQFYVEISEYRDVFLRILHNEEISVMENIQWGLACADLKRIKRFPPTLDIKGAFREKEDLSVKCAYANFVIQARKLIFGE